MCRDGRSARANRAPAHRPRGTRWRSSLARRPVENARAAAGPRSSAPARCASVRRRRGALRRTRLTPPSPPASVRFRAKARCEGRGARGEAVPAGEATPNRPARPPGDRRCQWRLVAISASRTSSRGRHAPIISPSGSTVSMSFAECTARSIVPDLRAASISFENSPLPPASERGRSRIRSPEVLIGTISIAPSPRPCAAASASRTAPACQSASRLPRVPMRILSTIRPGSWGRGPGCGRPSLVPGLPQHRPAAGRGGNVSQSPTGWRARSLPA